MTSLFLAERRPPILKEAMDVTPSRRLERTTTSSPVAAFVSPIGAGAVGATRR